MIQYIRVYTWFRSKMYSVAYIDSNYIVRTRACREEGLSEEEKEFMKKARARESFDELYGAEIIYERSADNGN